MHEFRRFGVSRSADTGKFFADKVHEAAGRSQSPPRTAMPHDEAETRAVANACAESRPSLGVLRAASANESYTLSTTLNRSHQSIISSLNCPSRVKYFRCSLRHDSSVRSSSPSS
jgi:hypothetical protein